MVPYTVGITEEGFRVRPGIVVHQHQERLLFVPNRSFEAASSNMARDLAPLNPLGQTEISSSVMTWVEYGDYCGYMQQLETNWPVQIRPTISLEGVLAHIVVSLEEGNYFVPVLKTPEMRYIYDWVWPLKDCWFFSVDGDQFLSGLVELPVNQPFAYTIIENGKVGPVMNVTF